jgi:hypothetical protein
VRTNVARMLNFSSMGQKLDDRVAEMRLEAYPALSTSDTRHPVPYKNSTKATSLGVYAAAKNFLISNSLNGRGIFLGASRILTRRGATYPTKPPT